MPRVILSISSDIGDAIAKRWRSQGLDVYGTTRAINESSDSRLVHCDLASSRSVDDAADAIADLLPGPWDTLVLAAGTQLPIGKFSEIDIDEWQTSLDVNFVSQFRFLKRLLPLAAKRARVVFFAGGGTNGSVDFYSAYTISKIASIKMCELLASEEPELGFSILGPGWVRTKIHQETLKAGPIKARANFDRTQAMLLGDDMVEMDHVVDWVDWIIDQPLHRVSGRNFSAVHDPRNSVELIQSLDSDSNLFKLRRYGNEIDWT